MDNDDMSIKLRLLEEKLANAQLQLCKNEELLKKLSSKTAKLWQTPSTKPKSD